MSREELFRLYFGDNTEEEVFNYEFSHEGEQIYFPKRVAKKFKKLTSKLNKVKEEIKYRGDRLECHRRELRLCTYQRKILCTKITSSLYRPTEILGGLT